ncbi:MAG: accessory factor UbiK family protein [Rhodospirillales bacterium]|nr:accessory factor UbiK family protein [Rhodospirillales bacterium]
MQTNNRFFDDMAKMMIGAMSAAGGMKEEMEARMHHQTEAFFARMHFVRREEFEVVRDMAALARQENDCLEARVAELEAALAKVEKAAKPTRKVTATVKATTKKAAPKTVAPKKAAAKKMSTGAAKRSPAVKKTDTSAK